MGALADQPGLKFGDGGHLRHQELADRGGRNGGMAGSRPGNNLAERLLRGVARPPCRSATMPFSPRYRPLAGCLNQSWYEDAKGRVLLLQRR
jgi:hypothetical protein